jgi:hypothetical protein
MTNVIRGTAVDFEKVLSLDGTFILNRYNKIDDYAYAKPDTDLHEFGEADLIANDVKRSRMQRPSTSNVESKKSQAKGDFSKIPESVPAYEVQENVQTYITHNKGAKWELIRAPSVTSKNAPIDCHTEDGCSLHLEIYSHFGELAPVYSSESAIGIVMGTGNLGSKLGSNDSPKNFYLSRDGGLTWRSVKPGSYIYEIGDHGALIVIAEKNKPITSIEFSWDEGLTWTTLKISDSPFFVENIIIEPENVSQ